MEAFLNHTNIFMNMTTFKETKFLLEIEPDRIGFNIRLIILNTILYRNLQREIFLKSSYVCGSYNLWMTEIKFEVVDVYILPLLLDSSTTFRISTPRSSKNPKHNFIVHSPGLRLLS